MSRVCQMRFAALLSCLMLVAQARGALVTTTFTLDQADATTNQLALTLLGVTAVPPTVLSGNFQAEINIDQSTGVITSLRLIGGTIATTDWTMTNVPTVGTVSGTSIGASVNTPVPPGPGAVNAGIFNATEHLLVLNTGTVSAPGIGFTQNFATNPLDIPGAGNGMITSTMGAGVFDITITLPIDSGQDITPPGVTLFVLGNLVASGQVAAVPEPASGIALLGIGLCGLCTIRRRQPAA